MQSSLRNLAYSPKTQSYTDIQRKVDVEKVQLLYENAPAGLIVNLFIGVILVVFLWDQAPQAWLLSWVIVLGTVTLLRGINVHCYRLTRARDAETATWSMRHTLGTACAGMTWGASGLLLPPHLDLSYQVLLAFTLGGIALGAIAVNATSMQAYIAFMVPTLLPLDAWFFQAGDRVHLAMGALGGVFIWALYVTARNLNTSIKHSLQLGLEREELIDRLRNANEKAAENNSRLSAEIEVRHRAEKGLRESETLYRAMFENNQAVQLLIDPESGAIVDANPAATTFYGAPRPVLQRKNITDINTLPYNQVFKCMARVLRSEQGHFDFRHRLDSGEIRDVEVHSSPVKLAGRQFLFSIVHDVTERKAAEAALRETEERFRNLIEGSIQGILITRNDGKPLFANQACADILGYESPDQILALESADRLLAPHKHTLVHFDPEGCLRDKPVPHQYEFDVVRKDGSTVTLQNVVTPVRWRGSPAVQTTLIDVTEHKRAEEQARQHQAELAHVDRVSTMGEMASTLAHELNQPLYAIATYAQACLRMLPTDAERYEKLVHALEQTAAQAQRAREIVQRVRQFLRKSDSGKIRINLNRLVRQAVGFTEAEARHKSVSIGLELDEHLPRISADPTQIEQVLINLIRNGIEAMNSAGPQERQLTICTRLRDDDTVQVTIHDTGPGLAAGTFERIFEPFHTTKVDGMGMGLSISRSIIRAHSGQLWPESHAEHGATFHFTLPVNPK